MKIYTDSRYKFIELFDKDTGFYLRSDILTDTGFNLVTTHKFPESKDLIEALVSNSTGTEPFMRSFPSLIDIGIMGHCGCANQCKVGCYQSGKSIYQPNMSILDFTKICQECEDQTQSFALGGRGDPNQHESFEKILQASVRYGIVPSYTTSGIMLNDRHVSLTRDYCGAVAVSWHSVNQDSYTQRAIENFVKAGVTTNIHYVLSKASIADATERIKNNDFPKSINAVIFLLHKNVGQGLIENVLKDEDTKEFFQAIENCKTDFKIGFDSCSVPFLMKNTETLNPATIISCDAGTFSMYISADMKALPCSFDQGFKYAFNIKNKTILEAWNSEPFNAVRDVLKSNTKCIGCSKNNTCKACPIVKEINPC